jgi:hypothetical protein
MRLRNTVADCIDALAPGDRNLLVLDEQFAHSHQWLRKTAGLTGIDPDFGHS